MEKSKYVKRHDFTDPVDIQNFNSKVRNYLNSKGSIKQGEGLCRVSKALKIGYMQTVYAYCSGLVKIEKYLKERGYDDFNEVLGILRGDIDNYHNYNPQK